MKRLAILVSLSGEGGVERMVLNLVGAFATEPGLAVDLLLLREESRHLRDLPPTIHLVRLGVRHSALAIPSIATYLRRVRPDALLAAKDRAGRAALVARWLARVPTTVVIRLGTTLSEAIKERGPVARWLRYWPVRALYGLADGIVAVSEGVAADIAAIARLPPDCIHVIRNPVVTPELIGQAREPVNHPWLAGTGVPVIVGMGRLTRQKDFPTLIRGFARVRRQRPARLLILGEGRDREDLVRLTDQAGVASDCDFPGFQPNPYAWLARASAFVLSSAWEGSPNALTEAMALGIPVASTDCRSGPREVLAGGRFGPLVPVGDADALAEAIMNVLDHPVPASELKAAVRDYSVETSARQYLRVLGVGS